MGTPARRVPRALHSVVWVAVLQTGGLPKAGPGAGSIPLCPGLTIVTAISQPEGDYESIKTIESVGDREITLKYSSEFPVNGISRRLKVQRTVLRKDLESATLYHHHFDRQGAITVPGTTAIGTSSAVLIALRNKGEAELGIFDAVGSGSTANRQTHPNIYDYQMVERIRRPDVVPLIMLTIPVLVNDVLVRLPVIEAKADYTGDKADFFFLDDLANPLALRYRIGRDALDVVKISYFCPEAPPKGRPAPVGRLERSLLETGRADVYSIYFSFNSDAIREESDSTLREIGEVMRRHPDWKLSIAGHTDNIGGDGYNLDLSRRRAAAVKQALVSRYATAPARLSTTGYGKNNPKGTNATLEGRARNRRVELVRGS